MCSDGLGVRVEDLKPRDKWFESPLEQFVLKTRAVTSILGSRKMIGKFRHGGKIPTVGIGKRREKFRYGGKFPSVGEKKSSLAWII